jgi:hypothetical protein
MKWENIYLSVNLKKVYQIQNDIELDDSALLDVMVNDDSDEDDIIQDFAWVDINNYKVQRENFTGSVGPQGVAKHVTEVVNVFES